VRPPAPTHTYPLSLHDALPISQVAGHPLGPVNPALYRLAGGHARGIVDVTKGNNTVSFTQGGRRQTVSGFTATRGYDLASWVGRSEEHTSELQSLRHLVCRLLL